MRASRLNRHLSAGRKRALKHEGPLADDLAAVFVEAGEDAARRFAEKAHDHLTAAAPSAAATMVAVFPEPEQAVALAQPGGEPAEVLHCTLAFLGQLDPDQAEAALAAVREAAAAHGPLEGIVGGVAAFGASESSDGLSPSIALPDVPGLAELRASVCDALEAAGIPYSMSHGWCPHMTLAYTEAPQPPQPRILGQPLTFDRLTVARGDVPRDLPLGGGLTLARRGVISDEALRAALGFAEEGHDPVAELARVAEEHAPEGGYGATAWNAETGTVFWEHADWTSNDEQDAAEAAFRAVEGVLKFECDAEGGLPYDYDAGEPHEGWVIVWPEGMTAAGSPPDWTPPHADEVIDVAAVAASLRGKSDPVRQAVAETMMAKALEAVGLSFDVENPFVGRLLAGSAAQVTGIAETTRLNVMRAIREAYEQGLTIPETADLIRAGMATAAPARGRLIAKTELAGIVNGASVAAAEIVGDAAGITFYKRWLCAPGAEHPRHEDYEGLDGQTVGMDEMFDVGGFQLAYPGDPEGPADEICACRCAVAMVETPDQEDEGEVVAALASREDSTGGGALTHARTTTTRREEVRAAMLAAAGLAQSDLVTNYDMTRGGLADRYFQRAALEAGYDEAASEWWPSEVDRLEDDDRIEFRDGDHNAVLRLEDGTLVYVNAGWGTVHVTAVGPSRKAVGGACASFRERYPASYLMEDDDARVPITFWTLTPMGPRPRLRKIEASPWEDIEGNYAGAIRGELSKMMTWRDGPAKDGQLVLFQGPPGTGKTFVLRALAAAWAPWAEFNYITDPDAFFVREPSYMIDVLLSESFGAIEPETGEVFEETDPESKWLVLILEDTGELLADDAKDEYGQGLSRLLNVVDGMIGQGLKVLAIVTTNDELGDLHPAVTRRGRCAAQIEFGPLTAEEATAWLGEDVEEPATLAELYGRRADAEGDLPEETTQGGNVKPNETTSPEAVAAAIEVDDRFLARVADIALASSAAAGRDLTEEDVVSALRERVKGGVVLDRDALAKVMNGDHAAADLPPELAPGDVRPERQPSPEAPAAEARAAAATMLRWESSFCPEGAPTDDGRLLWPGTTAWRDLPLTLMAMLETSEGGHIGAQVAGRIDAIRRDEVRPTYSMIRASGVFDDGEFGSEVARLVGDEVLRGLSVDLAIQEFDFIPASRLFDEGGELRLDALAWRDDAEEGDPTDLIDLLFGGEDLVFVALESVIGAATVCPFPAFAEASIALTASADGALHATVTQQAGFTVTRVPAPAPEAEAMTASAAGLVPVVPPAEWFENPGLTEPTALVVGEDGRVRGHAAEWCSCHTGFADRCVTPPRSLTNYAYFLLGEVEVEGGDPVPVGKITIEAPHADLRLGRKAATAHYDDTATAVADVTCGEDEHGIWVAGAVRPDAPAEKVRALRASPLSGDWRNVNGNLELVAILAVNVPGFPVPRTTAVVASADEGPRVLALVAAGMLGAEPTPEPEELTGADRARLAALTARASGGLAALAELAAR